MNSARKWPGKVAAYRQRFMGGCKLVHQIATRNFPVREGGHPAHGLLVQKTSCVNLRVASTEAGTNFEIRTHTIRKEHRNC